MSIVGSCDLSEVVGRTLDVTIDGVGTMKTAFLSPQSLAVHAGHVHVCFTGETLIVQDPGDAPWEIVSFDRQAKKLVVRPV